MDGVVPADLEGTQQRGGGARDLPRAAVLDVEQQKRGGDENQACGRAGEVDCGRKKLEPAGERKWWFFLIDRRVRC